MSSGQTRRMRIKATISGARRGFDRAIITLLTRVAERLTVYGRWSGPAAKTNGHVSGDALAWYVKEMRGYPLPNIWGTDAEH